MVVKHHVEGYDAFWKFMDTFDSKGEVVHIIFEGSIDPVTNQSWCSDCVAAEPIIESKIELLPEKSHLIYALVGDRQTWKDRNCPFRIDKRLALIVIPTVIRWKNCQRLEGPQLENPALVELIFTDELD